MPALNIRWTRCETGVNKPGTTAGVPHATTDDTLAERRHVLWTPCIVPPGVYLNHKHIYAIIALFARPDPRMSCKQSKRIYAHAARADLESGHHKSLSVCVCVCSLSRGSIHKFMRVLVARINRPAIR